LAEAVPPRGERCTWRRWSPHYANPRFQVFYGRLVAAGKAPKVALVAVMRKLIILLNQLLKNPEFQPT
jgi:hypothetical protein